MTSEATYENSLDIREKKLDVNIHTLAQNREVEKKLKELAEYWEGEFQIYLKAYPDAEKLAKASEAHVEQVKVTNTIDAGVRINALDIYDWRHDKNVYEGVSVAEYTTFNVNEEQAIAWASEHHKKALKLNLAEIKKVAKAGMEVHGVTLSKENRVKIASDLSSYLTNGE